MWLIGLNELVKRVVLGALGVAILSVCGLALGEQIDTSKVAKVAPGSHKIPGVIVHLEADWFIMVNQAGKSIKVILTVDTRLDEKKSNPLRGGWKYSRKDLSKGLTVEVEGSGDAEGALVARKIKCTVEDILLARAVSRSPESTPSSPLKDTTPPKIAFTSPLLARGQGVKSAANQIFKQSDSSLIVTGQATDDSGVREVIVRGAAARLDERGNFSAEVPLQVGDNPITVMATDNYGNRATESFTIRYEPPLVTGRYFALVIGNNRYPNLPPERQLKTAINDAQEVAQSLRADYGFEAKLLTDAKRSEIIKALNDYSRSLKPDDNLLIYYAGHGHFDDGTKKAYWIPTDAEMNYNANWIIADDVTANVRAIPARHILIVSDSCYSGTLTRTTDFRLSTPAERERYLEKMRGGTSRILMASGGNEPVADGGGGNHSIFAKALLDGLRGMEERVFTAEELFSRYIKEQVAGKSNQAPEYRYIQASGHDSGDFIFMRQR